MKWETEAIRYQGFQIWVGQGREGDWTASVNALPEQGALATAKAGEGYILGPFNSRETAVKAGKEYIDQQQRRQRS